ncbi:putative mycofactocin radical SAM maturase MftC [bioreactor metagenome]|uniref:Putative mycofactocin radical SAM maturase MftC n=1 Tax=bioreactor metagenome TaxID=1076179 RepID=A0A644XWD3_9ZZZZ|nr:radical SAM protein [Lutispora sp.]MEA4960663.1 radical SAM protein [Lutispora sp.]HCJ57375.1 hypothetical protein [Clostridiaceae bacterium]
MNDFIKEPIASVWEVTMGCNMRCMHCGSSCETPLEGELTTAEALDLISQMKEVGLKYVALSGGEPTIRKDIFLLARALSDSGISFSLLSNGWLIDEKMISKAIDSNLSYITMSLDGLQETHDRIRKPQSFIRIMSTLDLLSKNGIKTGIVTTLYKQRRYDVRTR